MHATSQLKAREDRFKVVGAYFSPEIDFASPENMTKIVQALSVFTH
jgi:hypothetical protein